MVQFYPWLKSSFLLFLGYGNACVMSLKEKKRKFTLRTKRNDNIDIEALSIQQC